MECSSSTNMAIFWRKMTFFTHVLIPTGWFKPWPNLIPDRWRSRWNNLWLKGSRDSTIPKYGHDRRIANLVIHPCDTLKPSVAKTGFWTTLRLALSITAFGPQTLLPKKKHGKCFCPPQKKKQMPAFKLRVQKPDSCNEKRKGDPAFPLEKLHPNTLQRSQTYPNWGSFSENHRLESAFFGGKCQFAGGYLLKDIPGADRVSAFNPKWLTTTSILSWERGIVKDFWS